MQWLNPDGIASLLPRLLWLTVHPRFGMQRSEKSQVKSFNLSNCFGFGENDVDLSLWEKSSVMNETSAPLQFQTNKPYRLALYVRPSERKRLQRTKAPGGARNVTDKQAKNNENENTNSSRLVGKRPEKSNSKVNKKVNVMLFDENVEPENTTKRPKKTPEKAEQGKDVSVSVEIPSARKNILKEVNTKPLTRTRQNKMRRSYERKFKKEPTEVIPEPPSEVIIKELEFKKLSRTKQKKMAKEEQDFEKWARSINSDFNDIDKFELSITYD